MLGEVAGHHPCRSGGSLWGLGVYCEGSVSFHCTFGEMSQHPKSYKALLHFYATTQSSRKRTGCEASQTWVGGVVSSFLAMDLGEPTTFMRMSGSRTGEGNGNPLQYSCLENHRDGGAWWVAFYGVAQSRTQLKRLSSSSSSSSSRFIICRMKLLRHFRVIVGLEGSSYIKLLAFSSPRHSFTAHQNHIYKVFFCYSYTDI